MDLFEITIITTTFLCSLVAGFLFAFAVVVFPGIKSLNDKEFLRSFQEMDLVIQNNQPIFMITWAGSVLTIVVSGVLGFWKLADFDLILLLTAVILYLFFVQLLTILVNVPLNISLQAQNVDNIDESELRKVRNNFERRWTRSNTVRTFSACVVSLMLIILIFRL